jgi:hypothetical protein
MSWFHSLARYGAVVAIVGSAQATRADVLYQSVPDLAAAPSQYFCSSCAGINYRVFDILLLQGASQSSPRSRLMFTNLSQEMLRLLFGMFTRPSTHYSIERSR